MPFDCTKSVLVGVPADKIEASWPHVEKFIDLACKRSSGRFTADDIKAGCVRRDFQLWVAYSDKLDAVSVTEIVVYPKIKTCRVMILTGRNRENWIQLNQEIGDWAKTQGCSMVEAFARQGWEPEMKKFGYRKTHVLLERDL